MRSSSREDIAAAFKALAAAMDTIADLDFSALTTPERFTVLAHCEKVRRQLPAVEHPLINQIADQATPIELSGRLSHRLADELRITRGEATRRIKDAADLGPRYSLTGEPMAPVRPATATAQRDGQINDAHVAVITKFFKLLPDDISAAEREQAEIGLAGYATKFRPDQLTKLAIKLFDLLVPDGIFDDKIRANKRSLLIGPQDAHGMSPIKGHLDPAARAALDAIFAKWAAPGMCNPADDTPNTSGTPSQESIQTDTRSIGQRNHDALKALCLALLGSGDLGQHNGLPTTIIVSTTLDDLEAGIGKAHTGGGSWMPMSDVIAMAAQAHHYLRIYQGAKELALFHTRRLASPAQRIVLHARDRGCTHPGCSASGYYCEAHHNNDYAKNPVTDVDDLTWRCGPHHTIISDDGWTTRRRHDGTFETIPPAHLDTEQARVNDYHHPERLLHQDNNEDDPEDPDDP